MNNKIIVTGGCGYIGSHTVVELLNSNYKVVIFDDLSNSSSETLSLIYKITKKTPEFIEVDLKNTKETLSAFSKHKDAISVIHFAAHKAVGESVENPLKYYKNNIYSLLNTLSCLKDNNIKGFIFSSSATVYGTPNNLPVTEKQETKRPLSPYGNTKKIAEEILEDFINSETNFHAISLRYFNPIGAHKSGLIGELPSGIPNNLLPYLTQTAAGLRDKLMVFGNDYPTKDGTPIRDYIHVVDVAKAHVLAVDKIIKNQKEKSLETYNLGTGKGYTVLEVIECFEKVSNCKLNYEITNRRPGDISELYADATLAKAKLNWVAKKTLEEMVSSSWKWQQSIKSKNLD